jgi:hypothetical protein
MERGARRQAAIQGGVPLVVVKPIGPRVHRLNERPRIYVYGNPPPHPPPPGVAAVTAVVAWLRRGWTSLTPPPWASTCPGTHRYSSRETCEYDDEDGGGGGGVARLFGGCGLDETQDDTQWEAREALRAGTPGPDRPLIVIFPPARADPCYGP